MSAVIVVGGGPIGLAVAWRLAARGRRVMLREDKRPGAWYAAAGMIAPVGEATFGEDVLTALLLDSTRRWPGFAAELGMDIGYREQGSLIVGVTAADVAEIERVRSHQERLGLPIDRLRPDALREREPLLGPRISGGAFTPIDAQVDPVLLHAALRRCCEEVGVEFGGPVRDLADLRIERPDAIVVAAGTGSARLVPLPIRPVRGETLRIVARHDRLRHMLRGVVEGRHVYVVPRPGGEVVIGATSTEEPETLARPSAGGVYELLRDAIILVPELAESDFAGARVGFRPGTPSNAPYLGELAPMGGTRVIVATGHYRNGIALTPVTADAITELVLTGHAPAEILPFATDSEEPS